jgi:hypothetical protein
LDGSFLASRALRAASASDSVGGAEDCTVLDVAAELSALPAGACCAGAGFVSASWAQPTAGIAKIAAAAAHDNTLRMATPPGIA